mmetsp:Transcript_45119/g.128861  ORF Transcript_45119/g.128861 Transcript_45119/m.128861 type:complete len:110 (+) Transcript_45119:105-434(+)
MIEAREWASSRKAFGAGKRRTSEPQSPGQPWSPASSGSSSRLTEFSSPAQDPPRPTIAQERLGELVQRQAERTAQWIEGEAEARRVRADSEVDRLAQWLASEAVGHVPH